MVILLVTGQIGSCSEKKETATEPTQTESETLLRGIPLSCYLEVGAQGIHPSVTSSLVELANFQSAQWAEISLEYAKAGDLEQAIILTEKIEDYLTRNQTLVELLSQLAAKGEYEQAKQLVERIKEYETYRAKAFARIGRYYMTAGNDQAARGMFSEAITFTKTLDAEYIQPTAFAEIAIEYAGAGKEEEAMQLVTEIKDETSREMALAGIARELAETEPVSKALQIVQMIQDDYYKAQALTDIAEKVTSAKLNPIVQMIKTIEDKTNRDAALAEIVMIYIRADYFEQAAKLTKTLLDDEPLLTEIIAEYAKIGQINRITTLTNSMAMDNEYWQNKALIEIVNGYARINHFDTALKLANEIDSSDIRDSALMAIGKQYAESGDYRQSLELFQSIATNSANEAISYDIESYFTPLVKCAFSRKTADIGEK